MNYTDPYRTLNEKEKSQLWDDISRQISTEPVKKVGFNFFPYFKQSQTLKKSLFIRDYAVATIFVLLLSSTGAFAAAAEASLPTSPLYRVKIHITEPLQSLTKLSPESKIHWNIKRTERRMEETKQLIQTKTLTPEIATALAEKISEHTTTAQETIQNLSDSDSNQSIILSATLIETIEKKSEEIHHAIEIVPPTTTEEAQNLVEAEKNTQQAAAIATIMTASKEAESNTQQQSDILVAQQKSDTLDIKTTEKEKQETISIEQAQFILVLQDIEKDLSNLLPKKEIPTKEIIKKTEEKPEDISIKAESQLPTEEITKKPTTEESNTLSDEPQLLEKETTEEKIEIKEVTTTDAVIEPLTKIKELTKLELAEKEYLALKLLITTVAPTTILNISEKQQTKEKEPKNLQKITPEELTRARNLRKLVHQLVLEKQALEKTTKTESEQPKEEIVEIKDLLSTTEEKEPKKQTTDKKEEVITEQPVVQIPDIIEIKETNH